MRSTARSLAVDALLRIEDGGYANLLLAPMLDRSGLETRDRHLVTELVYGTTRMRRACDWLIDAHLHRPVEPVVRAALRLGAYQLAFLATPPHAAVSATVDLVPNRARGLVNAVLRRVAEGLPPTWPDEATALSYPDWILERLRVDLGAERAHAALLAMNAAPLVTRRPDGYTQDLASQWVGELVGGAAGDTVVDLCAAPGGKATLIAGTGAVVAAADVQEQRARLVADNARRVSAAGVMTVVADGRRAPFRPARADRVLVDAPCSGLGVLRRRPDARWRIGPGDVTDLARLQCELLDEAVGLVAPGGLLVYSVCTLTRAETVGIDEWLATTHSRLAALPPPDAPWEPLGRGALLLPQVADTDGMYVLRLTRT
jgi:16S rRNA (cytosine967-C5)-methyltransferase